MKTIYISLIIATLLLGVIIVSGAGELIVSQFSKTSTMDKVNRDYLLTKVPTVIDKGQPLPKEIKPEINIVCSAKECKYSAVQDGIISSYDNVLNREYCSEFNKTINEKLNRTTNECVKYSIYKIAEIQDQVSSAVTQRLSDYANSSINQDSKVTTEIATGTITITEKK